MTEQATLFLKDARVVTMTDAGTLERASVLVVGEEIRGVGLDLEAPPGVRVVDAGGRVLMPGFVDAHTHALWAGHRLDEFEALRAGATYLDILQAGGGIMSTVRAVRRASREELAASLSGRLAYMLRSGTTTVEVKSGYGLSTADELKSLAAIGDAAEGFPGTVIPTALLGHAVDPDVPDFFDRIVEETLPAVSDAHPRIVVDAYCEPAAWPLDRCVRLFQAAVALGHGFRVHADQFTSLGMTEWAAAHGAVSVDHLEASSPATLERLAASGSFAVMLPLCGLHLDDRYADGRAFVDACGDADRVVVASNFNPGSAPGCSMPLVVALATRKLGLSVDEALRACTVNAARMLALDDRGYVAPGARADLILLRHADERSLAQELGGDPVQMVVCGGRVTREG